MARRRKQQPLRRHPPSEVELAAKRYVPSKRAKQLQIVPEPDEYFGFDESTNAKLANIQESWSETTTWLRSIGMTGKPAHVTAAEFIEQLRTERSHRIPPFTRIFKIDRRLFGFNEWISSDFTEELPPDEYAMEVEAAIRWTRSIRSDRKFYPDHGPVPPGDVEPVGRAHAWQEGGEWLYGRYAVESPLNAMPAYEYSTGDATVIRVDGGAAADFVSNPKRAHRHFLE